MKILIIAFALTAAATPALAAETRLFGAPSEPTIWGHRVEATTSPVLRRLMNVRQARPAPTADRRQPSEPTIWGHRLPEADPRGPAAD